MTSSFYPNLGGLQNATNEFASYLKHYQYNVQVLTNRYPIKLKEVELISEYRLIDTSFYQVHVYI